MSKKLILPPNYLKKIDGPLIFLAGHIQGAWDWQEKAIKIIQTIAPDICIASPKVDTKGCPESDFPTEMYNKQVDWETYHLRKAGENGVVLFWLAKEFKHVCQRAYAQTSRFELGEWKVRHERDKAQLVVGIEEGFTNAKYIKRRLSQDCPNIPICPTLEKTCEEAVRLALKTR